MRIVVTGASGLIGTALAALASERGHEVVPLARGPAEDGASSWDPAAGWIRPGALDGADAVVHLAGAEIAGGRWTDRRKRLLRESRIDATRLLIDHMASTAEPSRRPRVLVSASAGGYYGDRGDEPLTEQSSAGEGFLATLCADWEREARRAEELGVRAVQARFGIVLSAHGGALARMLPAFRLGAGGPLGGGRQWMPWIALRDAAGVIEQLLSDDSYSGPVNVAAPEPVTNAGFTRALGRALRRPAILPLPALVLRALFGQLADEALLASQRMIPERLLRGGFDFAHPELDAALGEALR